MVRLIAGNVAVSLGLVALVVFAWLVWPPLAWAASGGIAVAFGCWLLGGDK
jgi:hypothetical protein